MPGLIAAPLVEKEDLRSVARWVEVATDHRLVLKHRYKPWGEEGKVVCVAFTPDGSNAAVGRVPGSPGRPGIEVLDHSTEET